VSDVAEAQKRYYNFIDETTTKIENQYNRQHVIAENRAQEVMEMEFKVSKKKLINVGVMFAMGLSVILIGLGFAGLFFNIPLVRFFGFGNRIVGGIILMVIGFVAFIVLDKYFLKTKYDYLRYKKESEKLSSRTEKTIRDDEILKDKLDKYKKDLKIAKYELNDKSKSYDVEKNIENLMARNKFYQKFFGEDGKFSKDIFAKDRLELNALDDMPLKSGFKELMEGLLKKGNKLGNDELSNAALFGQEGLVDMSAMKAALEGKLKEIQGESQLGDERFADIKDENGLFSSSNNKGQRDRVQQEQLQQAVQNAQNIIETNKGQGISSNGVKPTFDRPIDKPKVDTFELKTPVNDDYVRTTHNNPNNGYYNRSNQTTNLNFDNTALNNGNNPNAATSGQVVSNNANSVLNPVNAQIRKEEILKEAKAEVVIDNVKEIKHKEPEQSFDSLLAEISKAAGISKEDALRQLQEQGQERQY
ncbi:MAG: sulfite exporter TauE/SafE family protein, partial [Clostridia bacterium]|nr:sulfite exporter TauE/SafE family protein [Clostridia bacterium]